MARNTSEKDKNYAVVFEQIIANLKSHMTPEIYLRNPRFEVRGNRLQIFLDGISGSHYEICFRQAYYEFALHFESTAERNLERRQAFDAHLDVYAQIISRPVYSGKLENQGRMRVWYQIAPEPLNDRTVNGYSSNFSKFIAATYPTLEQLYLPKEI